MSHLNSTTNNGWGRGTVLMSSPLVLAPKNHQQKQMMLFKKKSRYVQSLETYGRTDRSKHFIISCRTYNGTNHKKTKFGITFTAYICYVIGGSWSIMIMRTLGVNYEVRHLPDNFRQFLQFSSYNFKRTSINNIQ